MPPLVQHARTHVSQWPGTHDGAALGLFFGLPGASQTLKPLEGHGQRFTQASFDQAEIVWQAVHESPRYNDIFGIAAIAIDDPHFGALPTADLVVTLACITHTAALNAFYHHGGAVGHMLNVGARGHGASAKFMSGNDGIIGGSILIIPQAAIPYLQIGGAYRLIGDPD